MLLWKKKAGGVISDHFLETVEENLQDGF
ncbi:hypothetical protein BSG1_10951 [Bacillus sp. SG-1]|nr:hypothetical protein BSG1_10951 [Bacillus sp. SG-1]